MSVAICTLRPSGLTATFAAHPQSREIRKTLNMQMLLEYIEQRKAAAAE